MMITKNNMNHNTQVPFLDDVFATAKDGYNQDVTDWNLERSIHMSDEDDYFPASVYREYFPEVSRNYWILHSVTAKRIAYVAPTINEVPVPNNYNYSPMILAAIISILTLIILV